MISSMPMTNAGPLERAVPEANPNESWLAIHVARYDFARRYARTSGRLLDIACGSGYGTALLGEGLPQVECSGADVDEEAIWLANGSYVRENTTFIRADGMTFVDRGGFDTIVSLETIEHLDQPDVFVKRLVAMLRPTGRLIASVPSTPSTDANPYHRRDFTEAGFRRLFLRHGLKEVASIRLVDAFANTPTFADKRVNKRSVLRRMLRHYVTNPASLVRRVNATIRYGFENRYITTAWEYDH